MILKHIHNVSDQAKLQETVNKLVEWSEKWLLKFNGSKWKVLHTGLGKKNPNYQYTISDDGNVSILEETVCEKDLGVYRPIHVGPRS